MRDLGTPIPPFCSEFRCGSFAHSFSNFSKMPIFEKSSAQRFAGRAWSYLYTIYYILYMYPIIYILYYIFSYICVPDITSRPPRQSLGRTFFKNVHFQKVAKTMGKWSAGKFWAEWRYRRVEISHMCQNPFLGPSYRCLFGNLDCLNLS